VASSAGQANVNGGIEGSPKPVALAANLMLLSRALLNRKSL
jgi:hypothetical protein